MQHPTVKPAPPPEVNSWVLHPIPPEVMEEARQTFNLEEFLAEVREIERTGGHRFEDFIGEIEEIVRGGGSNADRSPS